MNPSESININQHTIKRLIKDIKELRKHPLKEHGIYYKHDENDILKGQALIIGPQDTPYQFGFYLFNFKFPTDYPHSPPKVTYLTNDGVTRFNPNLYISGKVCLSILNTWRGDSWTGCQTISTILLTLVTILHNKPLTNEPGIKDNDPAHKHYNEIITYKNFQTAIYYMINDFPTENNHHLDTMKELYLKNYDNIIHIINHIISTNNIYKKPHVVCCSTYGLTQLIDYNQLLSILKVLYVKLK